MAEYHKTCTHCGDEFVARNRSRFLCSSRCKKARYNTAHRDLVNQKQRIRNRTPEAGAARARYRAKTLEARQAAAQVARELRQVEREKPSALRRAVRDLWIAGVTKQCATCGRDFTAHSPKTTYCKRNCRPSKRASDRRRWNETVAVASALRVMRAITYLQKDGQT